jgi:hypothetical protein
MSCLEWQEETGRSREGVGKVFLGNYSTFNPCSYSSFCLKGLFIFDFSVHVETLLFFSQGL